jgi:hypothetical protein
MLSSCEIFYFAPNFGAKRLLQIPVIKRVSNLQISQPVRAIARFDLPAV